MPVVNAKVVVKEGKSTFFGVSDDDVERYGYTLKSRNGTAVSPTDYLSFSQSGGGGGPFSLKISSLDDDIYEGKTFEKYYIDYKASIVTLEGTKPPYTEVTTGYSGVITVEIDDEADKPLLSIATVNVTEGKDSKANIVVRADHAASFDYTIKVVIDGDTTDFGKTSYDVVMKAGAKTAVVAVPLKNDYKREGDDKSKATIVETFQVTAESDYDLAKGKIVVRNDDGPIVTLTPAASTKNWIDVYEKYEPGRIKVSLSESVPYDVILKMTIKTADGDKEITQKDVVIKAGSTQAVLDFVLGKGDKILELTENVKIEISGTPASGDERIYFDAKGTTDLTFNVHNIDALAYILQNYNEITAVSKIVAQVQDGKGLLGDALKYLATTDDAKGFLTKFGQAAAKIANGINVAAIGAEFLSNWNAAASSPKVEELRRWAAIKATVDLFDVAVGSAVSLASAEVVGGVLVGLGLTAGALPVLLTIGAGVGTYFLYNAISDHVKGAATKFVLDSYDEEVVIGPLSVLESKDGGKTIAGKSGDNLFLVSKSTTTITETKSGGYDTVVASASYKLGANLEALGLTEKAVAGIGNELDNFIAGNSVANDLQGAAGKDSLLGGAGNDVLTGGSGADRLDGGAGGDTASYAGASKGVVASLGTASANTNDAKGDVYVSIENLTGSSHADKLSGNNSANVLAGGAGADVLNGSGGNDTIYGGGGADDLYGGAGADLFQFKATADSVDTTAGRDTIFDFSGSGGDKIDLSAIDANSKVAGNQAFSFIVTKAFSGAAGELRYVKQASDTYVYADVNGDKKADLAIHLDDALTMSKGFFVL